MNSYIGDVGQAGYNVNYATATNAGIQARDPAAFFYSLYSCSSCRYVETDHIGGWYVFVPTNGLGAVGTVNLVEQLRKTPNLLDDHVAIPRSQFLFQQTGIPPQREEDRCRQRVVNPRLGKVRRISQVLPVWRSPI